MQAESTRKKVCLLLLSLTNIFLMSFLLTLFMFARCHLWFLLFHQRWEFFISRVTPPPMTCWRELWKHFKYFQMNVKNCHSCAATEQQKNSSQEIIRKIFSSFNSLWYNFYDSSSVLGGKSCLPPSAKRVYRKNNINGLKMICYTTWNG